jgi:hypothetical protein
MLFRVKFGFGKKLLLLALFFLYRSKRLLIEDIAIINCKPITD